MLAPAKGVSSPVPLCPSGPGASTLNVEVHTDSARNGSENVTVGEMCAPGGKERSLCGASRTTWGGVASGTTETTLSGVGATLPPVSTARALILKDDCVAR